MSEGADLSISDLRRKRAQTSAQGPKSAPLERRHESQIIITVPSEPALAPASTPPDADPLLQPANQRDFARWIAALKRRWLWLVSGATLIAALAGVVGFLLARCELPVQLTLLDVASRFSAPSSDSPTYRPPQLSSASMAGFLASPELLREVGARLQPPLSEKQTRSAIHVDWEKNSETVRVRFLSRDPQEVANLANTYLTAASGLSREFQKQDSARMVDNFSRQIAEIEHEESDLNQRLNSFRTRSRVTDPALENSAYEKEWVDLHIKIDMDQGELDLLREKRSLLEDQPIQQRLQEASTQLLALEAQGKKAEHPDVKRLRDEIAQLNRQLADNDSGVKNSGDSLFNPQMAAAENRKKSLEVEIQQLQKQAAAVNGRLNDLYAHTSEYNQLHANLDRLETYRKTLSSRRFEAQQYRDNAAGFFQPPATPVQPRDVDSLARWRQAAVSALGGGLLGLAGAALLILLVEACDPRLKSSADIQRVTGLPLLASLSDLGTMDASARKAWAFRTWTMLAGKLSASSNQGIVCGFISAAHGEGRSTWVDLLVEAARARGLHALKVDCHPAARTAPTDSVTPQGSPRDEESRVIIPAAPTTAVGKPESGSVVQLPLVELAWNRERRVEFQRALEQWRRTPAAVILIDLPPASEPEAILLAETLPHLVWLADAGKSRIDETRLHLQTLRHARCILAGAVLNHAPETQQPL